MEAEPVLMAVIFGGGVIFGSRVIFDGEVSFGGGGLTFNNSKKTECTFLLGK